MTIQLLAMTGTNANAETELEQYLGVVGPLMEAAGARILNRYELGGSIVGESGVQFVTLIEYPDEASVSRVFESAEYKSLDKIKAAAFSMYQVSTVVL